MSFTIHLGWWLLPAIATALVVIAAAFVTRDDNRAYGYGAAVSGVISLIVYGVAVVISLIAWFIWALVR